MIVMYVVNQFFEKFSTVVDLEKGILAIGVCTCKLLAASISIVILGIEHVV